MSAVAATNNKTRRTLIQFSRFLTVGAGNAVVDFLVYLFLTRGFDWWQEHYLLANAMAFLVANGNSFIWNRWWTFAQRPGNVWQQYFKFLSTSLLYLGFIQLGLWLLVSRWGMFDLIAKVIVIGLAMILYFTALRQVVFRRQPGQAEQI